MWPPFTATTSSFSIASSAIRPRPAMSLSIPLAALADIHDAITPQILAERTLKVHQDDCQGPGNIRRSSSRSAGPRVGGV